MKKYFWLFVVILMLAVASGCAPELLPKGELFTYVMLSEGDGYTITSENPMKVRLGENVSFDVEVKPEYIIDSVGAGAAYENGKITLDAVRYPTTIKVDSRLREKYSFFVEYDVKSGAIKCNRDKNTWLEGTEIVLTALPNKDAMFLGFSKDAYIKDGGEILTYATEFKFDLNESQRIYANYVIKGNSLIVYSANGGEVANSTTDKIFIQITDSKYICPNTLIDDGTIKRDGYVLCGYNTKPDGSGKFYGLGWNIIIPDVGVENLYAQWMKETDPSLFKYKVTNKQVTISGYTGKEKTVVIPQYIDGYPVTSVLSNTFVNCNFETLYFSRNLKNISNGAITGCKNFTTLYFSDSILTITEDFRKNCPEFSKLYMCAVTPPTYTSGRNGNYQIKYERLITAPGRKMVITAGSNCAYGVISEQLMDLLDEKYEVVNYGCNASTPAVFYMEVIAAHINPGDIHIHAPEISSYQWGQNDLNTTTWQIFEGAYDAFSDVDIRHFTNIFSSFSAFNGARTGRKALTYEHYSSETVNMYGDYIKEKVGQKYTPSVNSKSVPTSIIDSKNLPNLNRALDMIAEAGGKSYLSFAVVNEVSIKKEYKSDTVFNKYRDTAVDKVHATVISAPQTYVFESKYFFNSDYHLGTEGAKLRTTLLAKDINAQLALDKLKK